MKENHFDLIPLFLLNGNAPCPLPPRGVDLQNMQKSQSSLGCQCNELSVGWFVSTSDQQSLFELHTTRANFRLSQYVLLFIQLNASRSVDAET